MRELTGQRFSGRVQGWAMVCCSTGCPDPLYVNVIKLSHRHRIATFRSFRATKIRGQKWRLGAGIYLKEVGWCLTSLPGRIFLGLSNLTHPAMFCPAASQRKTHLPVGITSKEPVEKMWILPMYSCLHSLPKGIAEVPFFNF